ncbi:hypothetical protein CA54_21550 [Symmachiella macrocystis]|uniref:Uncharacterized protein n=1 Tax=Symmachiella macrocystis TaxID=2527985 RepID=A0A5C6BPJ9_9PLAN|nr:hypothetical protein CA54_21550 [Symmachiella macrocystis]
MEYSGHSNVVRVPGRLGRLYVIEHVWRVGYLFTLKRILGTVLTKNRENLSILDIKSTAY